MTAPAPANALEQAAARVAYRQRLDVFLASRDAADDITGQALAAGPVGRRLVAAATTVARYADEAIAIVVEEYRPRLDCREGCSHCCCKPGVLVTYPELLRIVDHVEATFTAASTAALIERARLYQASLSGRVFDDALDESIPCPLLVDDRCAAYEVRPLVCRGYNSTDVEACRRAHVDAREQVPIFAPIKDVTDGAAVGVSHALERMAANAAMLDLGSALNHVLTAPDGAAAIAAGASLTAAENRSWVGGLWTAVRDTARAVGRATNR